MIEQEKLEAEALEQVSGGRLSKEDAKELLSKTKKFILNHKALIGTGLFTAAALLVEGAGRKFQDVKTAKEFLQRYMPASAGSSGGGVGDETGGGDGNPKRSLSAPLPASTSKPTDDSSDWWC